MDASDRALRRRLRHPPEAAAPALFEGFIPNRGERRIAR
jgi:hypothetical protein